MKINSEYRLKKRNSSVIWNIALFFSMAVIMLFTIYWDYYAVWSYIDFSFLALNKSQISTPLTFASATPSQTPVSSPELTPEPSTEQLTIQTASTLTVDPEPTPIPHPGDRDGKFTDGEIIIGDWVYRSNDLSIEIIKYNENDITYFLAEVYVRDMDNFYAAFAEGKYDEPGIKEHVDRTSTMARENNAIFAISGDYYNYRDGGIIYRNNKLYRNIKEPYRSVLAIYNDGHIKSYSYADAYSGLLLDTQITHTYVFGPTLVTDFSDGKKFSEKDKKVRHPRCAIGMVEPYHYYFLLADGRKQGYSIGMTIYEMAQIFINAGCREAYALDGGGSATMIFMNELVNMPQGTTQERNISDSICIIETGNE